MPTAYEVAAAKQAQVEQILRVQYRVLAERAQQEPRLPASQLLASPFGIAANEREPSATAVGTAETRGSDHSPLTGAREPDLLASGIVLVVGFIVLYAALRRLLQ
jgi:hypothetical protein